MPLVAKIKVPATIRPATQAKLLRDRGFFIWSRGPEYVVYGKYDKVPPKTGDEELPDNVKSELNRRCSYILDAYLDPDPYKDVIIKAIRNYSANLPPLQQEYVENWIYNYVT